MGTVLCQVGDTGLVSRFTASRTSCDTKEQVQISIQTSLQTHLSLFPCITAVFYHCLLFVLTCNLVTPSKRTVIEPFWVVVHPQRKPAAFASKTAGHMNSDWPEHVRWDLWGIKLANFKVLLHCFRDFCILIGMKKKRKKKKPAGDNSPMHCVLNCICESFNMRRELLLTFLYICCWK